MPELNGLAVYDCSGELLNGYATELRGAPAVTRELPHARAHTRRTIARASRPIADIVAIRCGRTARAHNCGRAGAGFHPRLAQIEKAFRHGPSAAGPQ